MSSKRILIADDTAFMRLTLRRLLEQHGHEVVGEAADGVDAVEKYTELKPDIVTMDLVMPKMDGLAALKIILQLDPSAKIIVCSIMAHRSTVVEALAAGAIDFLVKPFEPQRVLEAIEKVGELKKPTPSSAEGPLTAIAPPRLGSLRPEQEHPWPRPAAVTGSGRGRRTATATDATGSSDHDPP